ncbi:hypothetical protein BGZ75_002965 [Mortierella antarctica]|nr:hypothetical protein BGZ75_002965 [Mortierella antarctica]
MRTPGQRTKNTPNVSSGRSNPSYSDSDSDTYTPPTKNTRKSIAPSKKVTRASAARRNKAQDKDQDQDQDQDQQLPVTNARGGRGSNESDATEQSDGESDTPSESQDKNEEESEDGDSDLSDAPLAELKRRRQVAKGKRKQPTLEQERLQEHDQSSKRPRPSKDTGDLFVTNVNSKEKDLNPILGALSSLIAHEQEVERELAFTVLDGYRPDERYRWPVREELLQCIPKNIYMETNEPNEFEKQGMAFVDDLTGVPKTEDDYSTTEDEDEISENESEYDSTDEVLQERLLEKRREAKRRAKAQQERHDDERAASQRLEGVQQFFIEEMTAFAQRQYRKGVPYRIKDFDTFQRQTLPRHLNRARRIPVGVFPPGEGQEDELTPIQERAATFAAEDSLRKVLNRLPYVIRQGALGKEPEYVSIGLPKPVLTNGGYERGWDTMMAAASLAGIEDHILKKVGHRMKNLLGSSKLSHFHERRSRAKVVTTATASADTHVEEAEDDPVFIDRLSGDEAPKPAEWNKIPRPFYVTDKWIDPLDPEYRPEAIKRNVRKRKSWTVRHVRIQDPNNNNNNSLPS